MTGTLAEKTRILVWCCCEMESARAGGRDPVETRPEVELVCCVHLHLWHQKLWSIQRPSRPPYGRYSGLCCLPCFSPASPPCLRSSTSTSVDITQGIVMHVLKRTLHHNLCPHIQGHNGLDRSSDTACILLKEGQHRRWLVQSTSAEGIQYTL